MENANPKTLTKKTVESGWDIFEVSKNSAVAMKYRHHELLPATKSCKETEGEQ